jgi:NADH-quinone oxidoreductase subunit M
MFGPLLSILIFSPLIGVVLIVLTRAMPRRDGEGEAAVNAARWIALLTTLAPLAAGLYLAWGYDPTNAGFQFIERMPWFGGFEYHVGIDGIALPLILLTVALMPLCIIASWGSINKRVAEYMIAFLVLEIMMTGVFAALDLMLFYVFFEAGLIPMFLIIGVWGGENRVYAAFKFFLYTLLGSILMLVAIAAMFLTSGTSDIVAMQSYDFPVDLQRWLWLAFFASFAVKLPMWPVHTWLPDAHVEAPTAGSVILAGVLLKMGGYGFLRFSLPMFPDASAYFTPLINVLSVIAIVYASLVAFRQTDVKKLIAYSSVAHMGFVTLGIFSGNEIGVQGALFQMISHGVISAALFLCVGVIYDRMHTREIAFYGGLVNKMPVYAAVFLLFTMGNVGLPGTSGFVGEILSMTGAFLAQPIYAAVAASGVILSAVYALTLYRKVVFGKIENPKLENVKDLDMREWVVFVPLVIATLVLGIYPSLALDASEATVQSIASGYLNAIGAVSGGH